MAALLFALLSPPARAQEASESYEREARKEFNQGHFRQAAIKYQLAAEAASDPSRRAKMHLGEAWSQFNARNPKEAREALRSVFTLNPDQEVVPDFYSADFMKLVEEVRASVKSAAAAAAVDVAETLRMAKARLKDGLADEVIHDLTYNVPPDRLGKEGAETLAAALEMKGRVAEAARVRSAAGLGTAGAAPPKPAPPDSAPAPTAAPSATVAPAPAPAPGRRAPSPGAVIGRLSRARKAGAGAGRSPERPRGGKPPDRDRAQLQRRLPASRRGPAPAGREDDGRGALQAVAQVQREEREDSPRPLRLLLRGEELGRRPRCAETRHRGQSRQPGPDRLPRSEAPGGRKSRACRAGLRGSLGGAPGRRSDSDRVRRDPPCREETRSRDRAAHGGRHGGAGAGGRPREPRGRPPDEEPVPGGRARVP